MHSPAFSKPACCVQGKSGLRQLEHALGKVRVHALQHKALVCRWVNTYTDKYIHTYK